MREPAGVEVGARLEGLDLARLALELAVRAVEEEGNERPDLVAEGGLGGCEGGLGDEFVVLDMRAPEGGARVSLLAGV